MPYVVETGKAKVSVKEYTERCVDVERFLGFCRECSSYNTRWSCPPFSFQPLQLCHQFNHLTLFARILHPSPDETLPVLIRGMREEKAGMMAELLNREKVSPYVGTFRRRMQLV